jgi:phenylacetic acid degradation operon negative regulatory protein
MTRPEEQSAEGEVHAPGAGAAGRLLVALLGDYWYASTEFIPSSALVDLAAEFGSSEAATRAALSRLGRRGWLQGTRSGRTTAYRLAPSMVDAAHHAGRAMMRFGAAPTPWDGGWTCVVVSLRGSDGRRRQLARRLRRLGLGVLFDDLWITPHRVVERVRRAVADLEPGAVVVFRGAEVVVPQAADLLTAWDLDGLRRSYEALIASVDDLRGRLDRGAIGPAEALVARTELTVRWRDLVETDPRLPDELLSDDWPRSHARRCFVEGYDTLGPLAELRVAQLVGERVGPAGRPRHHRVDDVT